MKRLVVLPILAGVCAAAPATALAQAADPCTLPGAEVVAANKQARVLSVAGRGDVKRRWFGCLTGHRPFLLAKDVEPAASDETHTGNTFFTLGGTWVGWRATSASDFGVGEFGARIVVRSLTGAKRRIEQDVTRYALKSLRIAPNGDVAWVLGSGDFREVDGVARTATEPTPLALALGVSSQSLAVRGGKVSFQVMGRTRTLTLTRPAPPATGDAVGPQGLDSRFGDCGTLVPASPKANVFTEATQLAHGPGGTFIAAGTATSNVGDPVEQDRFVVSRFSSTGQFDATFGGGGVVQLAAPRPKDARNGYLTGVVVQPDGKVVVAGYVELENAVDAQAVLARYSADGTLDPSFGSGGIVSDAVPAARSASIADLALSPDGTFVVAGQRDARYYVARLNADGSLDPAFGGDGVATDPGKGPSEFAALVVQPDGTIFAAGGTGLPLLVRFGADGTLLSSSSAAPPATAKLLALEPTADGGVVAAGVAGNVVSPDQALLARYTAAGKPDPAFDTDGFMLDPQISNPVDIALAPDGSLYVTASFWLRPGDYAGSGLIHYSAAGVRDTAFGIRGALGGTSSYGLKNGDVLVSNEGTALVAQDNGGAYAVSRFAVAAPATAATASASTVCAMATANKIEPLARTRKLDVSLRLRAPGTLRLEAVVTAGKRSVKAGSVGVFRPYTEGAVATIVISKVAAALLRSAKSAKLVVTGGAPGGAMTTYRTTLTA